MFVTDPDVLHSHNNIGGIRSWSSVVESSISGGRVVGTGDEVRPAKLSLHFLPTCERECYFRGFAVCADLGS